MIHGISPVEPHKTTDEIIYQEKSLVDDVVEGTVSLSKVQIHAQDLYNGKSEPFLKANEDPHVFVDGLLAPKPMKNPYDWEPMGDSEYRALYYAVCMFNQISRSGIEYKTWGYGQDDRIVSYPDTSPYYFATTQLFVSIMAQYIAPTARKLKKMQNDNPGEHKRLTERLQSVSGNVTAKLSVRQFMEIAKIWKEVIGVPRDFHAACADFVSGTCNILRLRKCAVMHEYDSKLLEFRGEPFGEGMPDLPNDPMPQQPRGQLQPIAILFTGDGSQRVGMLKAVQDLPRVREKLDIAKKMLGFDILELCVEGPAEKLELKEYEGVAMYLAGWAAYEKFLAEDPENARTCQAMAGIDVGEYVALSVAGVFPFEAGLELAYVRGLALKELCEKVTDQAACSVAGLSETRVRQLCELAMSRTGEDVCQITTALFNRGYVVSGKLKSIEDFTNLAQQDGALQAKILPGQKATHSPLMNELQWIIKSKLREMRHRMQVPWCNVYFTARGTYCLKTMENGPDNPEEALDEVISMTTQLLCESCWAACRWDHVMQSLLDAKITRFYECGPTKQLKALLKRVSKEAFENSFNYVV